MNKKGLVVFLLLVVIFSSTISALDNSSLNLLLSFNGNAIDSTGINNNVTVYGATLTADRNGNPNSAYSFDGVDDYINVGTDKFNIPNTNQFTISLWIKPNSVSGNRGLISRGQYLYPFFFQLREDGMIRAGTRTVNTNYLTIYNRLLANEWYHLVYTYSSGERRIYINGVLNKSDAYSGTLGFDNFPQSTLIGRTYNGANPSTDYFSGIIDDVRIYNQSLSASDVQEIYSDISLPVSVCGNNILELGEFCDGNVLNNQSCSTQGFNSGLLSCNADCSGYDVSSCYTCTDLDNDGFKIEGGLCGLVDCNDNNSNIFPGAPDSVCNGLDNDCDLSIDEDYLETTTSCGVGACSGNNGSLQCLNGVEVDSCNPFEGAILETCEDNTGYDTIDNNCDGSVDLDCSSYCDVDGDNYSPHLICIFAGYSLGDCNDNNALINPNATEIPCNLIDENCNSNDDLGTDLDNDGFKIEGGLCGAIDCNDQDNVIYPEATELCDGKDNQCSGDIGFGLIDENCKVDVEPYSAKVWLPFNGDALDASGNNNSVTVYGATLTVDRNGNPNSAYSFDGVDDYMDLGAGTFGIPSTNSFTLSMWVNPSDVTKDSGLLSRGQYIYPFFLQLRDNGFVRTGIRFADTAYLYSSQKLSVNKWYNVVYTYGNGVRTIYIDGELNRNNSISGTLDLDRYPQSTLIGRTQNSLDYFNGAIDNVKIYDKALTSSEVKSMYNQEAVISTPICGNSIIEATEVCDGSALGGKTCLTQGFDAGTLSCASDCSSFIVSGCTSLNCTDNDRDGFRVEGGLCGPIDCNDNNSKIFPGAMEICGNNIDDNCDNVIDDAASCLGESPIAKITAHALPNIEVGEPIVFDALKTVDNKRLIARNHSEKSANFEWDFGDGYSLKKGPQNPGGGTSVLHIYMVPGQYVLNLTVTDLDGNRDSDTMNITVTGQTPMAGFELWHAPYYSRLAQYIYPKIPSSLIGRSDIYLRVNVTSTEGYANIVFNKNNLAEEEKFLFNNSALPAGNFTVLAEIIDGSGNVITYIKEKFLKSYAGAPRIGINENNAFSVDGKVMFLNKPWMLDGYYVPAWSNKYANILRAEGWYPGEVHNIATAKNYLDLAKNNSILAIMPERWEGKGAINNYRYSDINKITEYIYALKNHSALAMWFWADEPNMGGTTYGIPIETYSSWAYESNILDQEHPVWNQMYGFDYMNYYGTTYNGSEYDYLNSGSHFGGKKFFAAEFTSLDIYPIAFGEGFVPKEAFAKSYVLKKPIPPTVNDTDIPASIAIFNDLVNQGYIDSNGKLQTKFKFIEFSRDFALSGYNDTERNRIFNILNEFEADHPSLDANSSDTRYSQLSDKGPVTLWIEAMDKLVNYNYDLIPVHQSIESQDLYQHSAYENVTADKITMLAWICVTHGMKGINWFHYFAPTPQENFVALEKFNNQTTELAEIILGPKSDIVVTDNSNVRGNRVDSMIKETEDAIYLFTVRVTEVEPEWYEVYEPETITTTFSIPGLSNNTIELYDENGRTLTMQGNNFTDSFSRYGFHIYKIMKNGSSPQPVNLCGNNILNSGESCDGTFLSNQSCSTFGFHLGTLSCNANCIGFNTSQCVNMTNACYTIQTCSGYNQSLCGLDPCNVIGSCTWDGSSCIPVCVDNDGDGYNSTSSCGIVDCDDNDPLYYPDVNGACVIQGTTNNISYVDYDYVYVKDNPYYVGGSQIAEFANLSDSCLDTIRSKQYLFGSRSFGQNMLNGLRYYLTPSNRTKYAFPIQQYDIYFGGQTIPADAWNNASMIHALINIPAYDRVNRMASLVPQYSSTVDVVMLEAWPTDDTVFEYNKTFYNYTQTFDQLSELYPNIKFVYQTRHMNSDILEFDKKNTSYSVYRANSSYGASAVVTENSDKYRKLMFTTHGDVIIYDFFDILSTREKSLDNSVVCKINSTGGYNHPDCVCTFEYNNKTYRRTCPEYDNGVNMHPGSSVAEIRFGKSLFVLWSKLFCNSNSTVPQSNVSCEDNDGDGYNSTSSCGIVDCNDNNASINPDSTELCDDNLDNNCNGQIDEGCNVSSEVVFPIIINHTSIDEFDLIPDEYIEKAKQLNVQLVGQSHSRQTPKGLDLLSRMDPKYSVSFSTNPLEATGGSRTAPFPVPGNLSVERSDWSGSWQLWSVDDNAYWSTEGGRTRAKNTALAATSAGRTFNVSLWGWCWDMCSTSFYSQGAFEDEDINTYLSAIQSHNSDVNSTNFVYVTSITDCGNNEGLLRINNYNNVIREAAVNNNGILFDQADIESWYGGARNTTTAVVNGQTVTLYPRNSGYAESVGTAYTTGHTNEANCINKAKALWVLLARLAGWKGPGN